MTKGDRLPVKDLRIFENRELKDIVLIDNAAYSFANQLDNGIPIIPFEDKKDDTEMLDLLEYLRMLSKKEDVREENRR